MAYRLVPTCGRPTNMFDVIRKEMDQLVNRVVGSDDAPESRPFAPDTNLAETEKEYEITVDLPGMNSEDFNLEFDDGQLLISGERKQEKVEKGKTYHRVERTTGRFRRGIALGPEVDPDRIEATYKDGVLRVIVPKIPAAVPKKIEVKA